ncbi:MAG: hypothetical protein FWD17_02795 [Polyangiaceae bacterium]|nr:hypothetical protein [Polyangiaceae bacterium]
MTDPKRILDRAAPGSLERALLENARDPGPTREQCDAVWAALAAQLGAAAAAGAAGSAAGAGVAGSGSSAGTVAGSAAGAKSVGLALLLKGTGVVVAAGTLTLAGGVAMHRALSAGGRSARASANVVHEPAAVAPARSVPEREPRTLPQAPSEMAKEPSPAAPPAASLQSVAIRKSADTSRIAHPANAKALPSATATAGETARPPDNADKKASASPLDIESALVLAAHDAVRSGDCGGALETIRETRERFPRGALGQERDALQVEALACAGQSAAAEAAARAFVHAYPDSPHLAATRRFLPRAAARGQ